MTPGIILLALSYVLSQFFRAFLAVLSGPLETDLGTGPDELAVASGLWFVSFALMQLPVGWALDTIGPRRTAAILFGIGGAGGAAVFAVATAPWHIHAAMLLIGIGCSPVLMASYYIFAKDYAPVRFATLAALMIGVGTVGNLVASYPTALAAETIGWRATMWALAGLTGVVALGILLLVRDPSESEAEDQSGSLFDLLRMPGLWLLFPIMFTNYIPVAAIRGLWIGPYLNDVFGLTTEQIGQATLVMSLAMIAGVVAYGPLDRFFGTRKWVVVAGNMLCATAILSLAGMITQGAGVSIALMAAIGFLGASFPVIIAHARSFFPPNLIGRGVTLMNLFGIGGVGVAQFASGSLHRAVSDGPDPATPYAIIFAVYGALLLIGLLIYLFSREQAQSTVPLSPGKQRV